METPAVPLGTASMLLRLQSVAHCDHQGVRLEKTLSAARTLHPALGVLPLEYCHKVAATPLLRETTELGICDLD